MGFLGFFNFAFACFNFLAWPLFALGYPLYASIRAIETNSNYHMRKLVTYWILFSLISLFELAFVKLIEWIPFWPYIKLGTICWLVLPRFNGARYCYKSFIQPCLSVNFEEVMNRLYKRPKASVEKDNFLSVAERYVTENGTEALEKLIATKFNQKDSRTDFGVEKIKAVVTKADKKEMPLMVKGLKTDFGVEEITTVVKAEKKEIPKSNGNEIKVVHKDISRVEQPGKNAPVPESPVKHVDPILLQDKKKAIAAVEVKEMTVPPVPPASVEGVLPTPLEKVQKEWTCAVCQVSTTCEANLNSHLTGRKHRDKCEELKSQTTKQTTKLKACPSNSTSKGAQDNQGSTKPASRDGSSQDKIKNQKEKVVKSEVGKQNADSTSNSVSKNLRSWCPYCSITCTSETDFLSHLKGKKHLARVQDNQGSTKPASRDGSSQDKIKKQKEKVVKSEVGKQNADSTSNSGSKNLGSWWCPYCSITCMNEPHFLSHLNRKKHLARVQEMAVYSAGADFPPA